MAKIALIIGHNSRSPGAYSETLKKFEYNYCKEICERLKELTGVDVYERKPDKKYTREMRKVLKQVNRGNYDYIFEVHFNSVADKTVKGSECLVYWKNEKAQKVASCFLKMLEKKFDSRIRTKWSPLKILKDGKKVLETKKTKGLLLVQSSGVRGGFGICNSKGSYILVEPFFGSNKEDAERFADVEKVAQAFATFIEEVE